MDVKIGRELTTRGVAESGITGVVGFSILGSGLILVIGGIYHCGMTAYQTIRRLLNG